MGGLARIRKYDAAPLCRCGAWTLRACRVGTWALHVHALERVCKTVCWLESAILRLAPRAQLCIMKFSLEKAVSGNAVTNKPETKRPPDVPQESARRAKALKASDVVVEDGPKPPPQTTRKLAANAPVNLVIYRITAGASAAEGSCDRIVRAFSSQQFWRGRTSSCGGVQHER